MCWSCVEEEGGHEVLVTDEMVQVAGLIWDWYRADEENGCGGALHVQLDDYNLDDYLLQDDWFEKDYIQQYYSHYQSDVQELGNKIVRRLRSMTAAERNRTVEIADPYGDVRPYSEEG